MLITFLLVLSALGVNTESVVQDGLRKSRQLDLGLQDIFNPDEDKQTTTQLPSSPRNEVINGYLPPVLSPEVVRSQSQPAFDFKSVNFVEKESDLCQPPFENESCVLKASPTSDTKIPKPSVDLVPPFNDLEQELANKATTLFEQTTEDVKTTVENRIFTTTTETPTTIFKTSPSENKVSIIKTTAQPRPAASTEEVTNELRSYLPPQPDASPAAQTNIEVVQPPSQGNSDRHQDHHHDHHNHHGENFNICDDAFHAFLCAPLKARKRITGALPTSLLGQSSFINYQKTLLNFDRETASSNTFRNEYLPPKLPSTNLIQSTYTPASTTKRPVIIKTTSIPRSYSPSKFIPQSSISNNKFYLPPLSGNSFPVKSAPSNRAFSALKTSTAPTPTTLGISSKAPQNSFFSNAPTIPVFNSHSSRTNNFYLPPNPSPQPAASFVSTTKNVFPTISTTPSLSSSHVPVPAVPNFGSPASNSIFITQKSRTQPTLPTFATTKRPVVELQSFPTTIKPIIRVSSFAPEPLNSSGYLPPSNEFRSASKPVPTTAKPSTKEVKNIEQSSNADRAYLPPDSEEPAAAQISSAAVAAPQVKNPFHHGRDLCTDPFHSFLCTSAKPRKRITGDLPSAYKPESSNTNELRLKPEASSQDENVEKPVEDEQVAQNVGYKYPKPLNPLPTLSYTVTSTAAPTTGYSYPKPDKIFPLPSQQDIKIAPPATTKKPEPTFRPSEAKVVSGYEYPKPDKIFPLPAGPENIKVITTTSSPSTGYSYPKPQKPFPLPSEQKEVRQKPTPTTLPSSTLSLALPANTVKGYQYPKPEQSLKLPEKKGYSYPKPEKKLELPTESLGSKHKLPQSKSNLEALGNLGSAEFIPVNKLDIKRSESSKLIAGLRRFGERMKKRERDAKINGKK